MKRIGFPSGTASLAQVPTRAFVFAGLWMSVWYITWLVVQQDGGNEPLGIASAVLGFAPLLVWALLDFRAGLLLSVLATPFFVAPIIPHWFTQGFAELLAVSAILGFLLRHRRPHDWLSLWRPEYVWLGLILAAAAVSLVFAPLLPADAMHGPKYGLAEIAGFCLAMGYLVVLRSQIRNTDDGVAILRAAAVAATIAIGFGLLSVEMIRDCLGGYSSRTALTTNQGVSSTFANPNYFVSYMLVVLPLALFTYWRSRSRLERWMAFVAVVVAVLMVQASLSRMGLLGLITLWLGWVAITRWRPGTRAMSMVLGLLLPLTFMVWFYPACTCSTAPAWACTPRYLAEQYIAEYGGVIGGTAFEKKLLAWRAAREGLAATVAMGQIAPKGGLNDPIRLQLAKNALNAWTIAPATGVGAGLLQNYSIANDVPNRAHNMVLTILAEQGVIGLAVWSGWWVLLASRFWKYRHTMRRPGHPLTFLALSFVAMTLVSMFADQYRVIWLWQLAALILAMPSIATRATSELKAAAA